MFALLNSCTSELAKALLQAARATERQPRDVAPAETGLAGHVPQHLRHLASNFGAAQTPIGAPVDFSVLCSCNAIENWTYAQVMWQAGGWFAQCSCLRCALSALRNIPHLPLCLRPTCRRSGRRVQVSSVGRCSELYFQAVECSTAVFLASVAPRLCGGLQPDPGVRMLECEGERMAVIVGLVRDLRDVQHITSKKAGPVSFYVPVVYQRAADGDTSLRCFTDPHAAADYCLQLACQQAGGPGHLTPAQHLQGRAATYDFENQTVLALLAAGLPLTFSPHLDRTRGWDAAVLDNRGADLGAAVRVWLVMRCFLAQHNRDLMLHCSLTFSCVP